MANFVLELGKQSASLGVSSAYGEPIDVGGVQLVPVAVTAHGFGGGEGEQPGDGPEGSGGGGAGYALPIGAYVRRDGDVRFEPNLVALLAVGVPFVWVAGRALSRVIRALKK